MRPAVQGPDLAGVDEHRDRGHHEQPGRHHEDADQRQLDLPGPDRLAEVLRRAADHQPGEEHREHGEEEHPVEAGADPAGGDLAEQDVGEGDAARRGGVGVVHGIDRAGRRHRRADRERRRLDRRQALLLALHVRRLGRPAAVSAGVVRVSVATETAIAEANRITIAAKIATPCRGLPSMRPKRKGMENVIRSSLQSSSRSVKGVELSNGWAELALKKPPPFVPTCLIATWLAAGPRAIVWRAPSRVWRGDGPVEGHDDAAGDEDHGQHQGERQEDVVGATDEIGPEVADPVAPGAGEAADEGHGDGHPDGGGDEVLDRQAGHLGQVRHRRLAAVVLPVRVGDEAPGGVEGDVRADALHALRVQRERALQPLQGVEQGDAGRREDEQAAGVLGPPLIVVGATRRNR